MLNELFTEYENDKLYEKRTSLCDLCKKYGSDKSTWHNYTTVYHFLFQKLNLIDKSINFFELGLGTNNTSFKSNMGQDGSPGASLYAFSEYVPQAKIFGADIDKGILFQTEKIKTFQCDQTDANSISNLWKNVNEDFDIIIDDGLHESHANINFLTHSFHKLKENGIFVIEDILNEDLKNILDFINQFNCKDKILIRLPMNYEWTQNDDKFRGKINSVDNNMAILIK